MAGIEGCHQASSGHHQAACGDFRVNCRRIPRRVSYELGALLFTTCHLPIAGQRHCNHDPRTRAGPPRPAPPRYAKQSCSCRARCSVLGARGRVTFGTEFV